MSEKVTGYLLLFLGLFVIGYSALNIYQVFTKKIAPVQLFTLKGVTIDLSQYQQPPLEILPATSINELSNLSAHYFLISFVVGVGFRISTLGIQLLRPIEVKLRATDQKST